MGATQQLHAPWALLAQHSQGAVTPGWMAEVHSHSMNWNVTASTPEGAVGCREKALTCLAPKSCCFSLLRSPNHPFYHFGKLLLPTQWMAPIAKAEASCNPTHFLSGVFLHTYKCIICIYIFNINYREDRAVFQMSTYCTNRKWHCSNRSLKKSADQPRVRKVIWKKWQKKKKNQAFLTTVGRS